MRAKPRKRFGQHFLHDVAVLREIARCVGLRESDVLVEIGPGQGALTAELYGQCDDYLAIEIDRDLVPFLRAQFPSLEVVNADVLRVNFSELRTRPMRVVGNLPYNISSPLMLHLLEHLEFVEDMHFLIQKEVADRLAAQPGSKAWGRLGVWMQYFCRVEKLFDVNPESFEPPPKVMSSVVRLTPHTERLALESEELLATLLRSVFSQRRKVLSNSLRSLPAEVDATRLDWAALEINPQVRAEALSLADFVKLANALAATLAA